MSEWLIGNYPTEAALERVRTWGIGNQADLDALWSFVRGLWVYKDRFVPFELGQIVGEERWLLDDVDWYVSTGGWSGHEDVIDVLQRNWLFWSICWRLHRTGGHFWFRIEGLISP